MDKTPSGWTVIDRDAGVLSYLYSFGGAGSANCMTARLADGKLLVLSPAVGMSDEAFDELAQFGEVGALVANNGFHHLGQAQWRERFPQARAFAAPGAAKRIADKSDDAGGFEPLSALTELLDATVEVVEPPATKCGETWASAEIAGGYAWFMSDLIGNMPKLPSNFLFRLLFKWTGSAPGFRLFKLTFPFTLKDKKKVLAQLLQDVRRRPPSIIVPSHGDLAHGDDLAKRTEAIIAAVL